jgi:hypothetical protein
MASSSGPWPAAIIWSDICVWIIAWPTAFTRMPRVAYHQIWIEPIDAVTQGIQDGLQGRAPRTISSSVRGGFVAIIVLYLLPTPALVARTHHDR